MRLSLAVTLCSTLLGCGVTANLGPQTKTEYILVHPGNPLQVMENRTVLGKPLGGDGAAQKQDVGGWIMMPPDHWKVVKEELEKK